MQSNFADSSTDNADEYNAVVREWKGPTLKVVARTKVSDFKDLPEDWTVSYKGIRINTAEQDVQNFCCSAKIPLQLYKPIHHGFEINVRTLGGTNFKVMVTGNDTVDTLKQKISHQNPNYPPQTQQLYIHQNSADVLLDDWGTLQSFGITSFSTVWVLYNAEFVERFQSRHDNCHSKGMLKLHSPPEFTHTGKTPSWAKFGAGLNLTGICLNRRCASQRFGTSKQVIMRKSYGQFRLLNQNRMECPACSEHTVDINGYILYKTKCLILYKLCGFSDTISRKVKDYSKIDVFVHSRLNLKHVVSVEFTAVKRSESFMSCVKCDLRIFMENQESRLECGHAYHKWCKTGSCLVCKAKFEMEIEKQENRVKRVHREYSSEPDCCCVV